jgi:glycerol-1-phosphate dehydrogenase [NAD(P)+]
MEKLLQQYGILKCSLQEGALQEAAEWLKTNAKNPVIISDCNTESFAKIYDGTHHVFPTPPKPEKKIAEELALLDVDYFVAVGSGTISDLVKYASHLAQKPYIMIPTAPSMNGYFSITASLIETGKKESYQAHLPTALFADLKIIAAAPIRLIRSGVGDSICRSTAQADWLLSHLLLGTYYNEEPFNLVQKQEHYIFTHAQKLITGDKEAIRHLMELLLLGGLGMTLCKGSYPASQGEHMIAHTMEMLYGDQLPETFHGEQIGVTTLVMAQLQERILAQKNLQLPLKPLPEKEINLNKINELNEILTQKWTEIRQTIKKMTQPYTKIFSVLDAIAAPKTPESLGWRDDWFLEAVAKTPTTRNRFTFLDLGR